MTKTSSVARKRLEERKNGATKSGKRISKKDEKEKESDRREEQRIVVGHQLFKSHLVRIQKKLQQHSDKGLLDFLAKGKWQTFECKVAGVVAAVDKSKMNTHIINNTKITRFKMTFRSGCELRCLWISQKKHVPFAKTCPAELFWMWSPAGNFENSQMHSDFVWITTENKQHRLKIFGFYSTAVIDLKVNCLSVFNVTNDVFKTSFRKTYV